MYKDRIGTFNLSRYFLEDHIEDFKAIMGQCIIYKAEHSFVSDGFEYLAYCAQFDKGVPGVECYRYKWVRNADGFMVVSTMKSAELGLLTIPER